MLYKSIQQDNVAKDVAKNYLHWCSRAAGSSSTRAAARRRGRIRGWPSCSRRTSSRSTLKDANDRGVRDGEYVWVKSPTGAQIKVKALVTERVAAGTTFIPFPFLRVVARQGHAFEFYPEGAYPIVRAEAVNTATTYGYDSVTMMQETKTTLCQVARLA